MNISKLMITATATLLLSSIADVAFANPVEAMNNEYCIELRKSYNKFDKTDGCKAARQALAIYGAHACNDGAKSFYNSKCAKTAINSDDIFAGDDLADEVSNATASTNTNNNASRPFAPIRTTSSANANNAYANTASANNSQRPFSPLRTSRATTSNNNSNNNNRQYADSNRARHNNRGNWGTPEEREKRRAERAARIKEYKDQLAATESKIAALESKIGTLENELAVARGQSATTPVASDPSTVAETNQIQNNSVDYNTASTNKYAAAIALAAKTQANNNAATANNYDSQVADSNYNANQNAYFVNGSDNNAINPSNLAVTDTASSNDSSYFVDTTSNNSNSDATSNTGWLDNGSTSSFTSNQNTNEYCDEFYAADLADDITKSCQASLKAVIAYGVTACQGTAKEYFETICTDVAGK